MKVFRMPRIDGICRKELKILYREMIQKMTDGFINQVLNKLKNKTISEFAFKDSNYSTTIKDLSKRASKSIFKPFTDKLIDSYIQEAFAEANERISRNMFKKYQDKMELDIKSIVKKEIEPELIQAQIVVICEYIKRKRNEYMDTMTQRSLEVAARGGGYKELLVTIKKTGNIMYRHLDRSSQDQVANFTTVVSGLRAQSLGIKYARWRTSKDKVVRMSHKDRDSKYYEIDKGLWSNLDRKYLRPGFDFNCRCWEEYILDANEIPKDIRQRLER